ncbi:MAG: hypothetical protein ACRD20_02300 [Terriglobales bacterium]
MVIGNLEVVETWDSNATTTTTISSTRVSSWANFSNISCSAAGGPGAGNVQVFYGLITSNGAETVTFGRSQTRNSVFEFTNTTATTDGTAFATYTASGSTVTSPNLTPTVDGDLLFFVNNDCDNLLPGIFVHAPGQFLANPSTDYVANAFEVAGNSGSSYNTSWEVANTDRGTITVVAFKPAASLQITTTAIPDMALTSPCNFQMASNGGVGAVTWAITAGALPPGCSMNSSGAFSGTPLGSPVGTVTIQATDSLSATSASKTFTINVGNSYATPTYVQTHDQVNCAAFPLGTTTPGNILFVSRTSGSSGLGVGPIIDDVGDVFAPLPWASDHGHNAMIYIGFLTAGASTLICSANGGVVATEFSGFQPIFEPTAWSVTAANGGTSPVTSNAFLLPVADTIFANFEPFTGPATTGAGTGFTADKLLGGNNINTEYKIGAPPGSSTASFTQSGNTDGNSIMVAGGFRPLKIGTAATALGHPHSQIY